MILASIMNMLLEARKFTFLPEGEKAETKSFSGFSGHDFLAAGVVTPFIGQIRETHFKD